MNNTVSLNYVENYEYKEVEKGLSKALENVGGLTKFIKPKSKVMLKCTLSTKHQPDDALTTHPSIIKVLAEKITKLGASCIIVDNPDNLNTSISKIYETSQMLDASNEGDAELNSNNNVFKVEFEGKMTKKLTLADALNDVDLIINVPKLVVDSKLGLRGCLDNLFGLLPTEEKIIVKSRLSTPVAYNEYLLDLYKFLKNKLVLNIVDGIVARESNNSQRIMNSLIVGENPFAVDSLVMQILNVDSSENTLLHLATTSNLYNPNNDTYLGDKIETFIKPDFSFPVIDKTATFEKESKTKHRYKSCQSRPNIITSKCKGCGVCIKTCPNKAITEKYDKNNEMYAHLDYSKCISCFRCVRACPYQVINTITPIKNKQLNNKLSKRLKVDNE